LAKQGNTFLGVGDFEAPEAKTIGDAIQMFGDFIRAYAGTL